jgi:hypothetical protein
MFSNIFLTWFDVPSPLPTANGSLSPFNICWILCFRPVVTGKRWMKYLSFMYLKRNKMEMRQIGERSGRLI